MESLYARRPRADIMYDVIVAGGGPAALGAALAASVSGARTLILEARSQFGGTATAAMWMNFNFLYKDNVETDRGGVNRILADAIKSGGTLVAVLGERDPNVPGAGGNYCIHPEYFKKIIFELFDKHGIDYSLYCQTVDVIMDGGRVAGVKVSAKEGEVLYRARTVIDATGDGDIAWRAGCEMEDGNPDNGWRAPVTLTFALGGIDTARLNEWLHLETKEIDRHQFVKFNELLAFAFSKGYLVPDWVGFDDTTLPGVVSFNNGTSRKLHVDGTRSFDLTIAERLGAEEALEFVRFVRDYKIPGMENAYLLRSGGFVAVRETRRLVGEYIFTDKDLMIGTDFPDAVASKYGGRDPVGQEHPYTAIKQGARYPYRSLLPRKVDGLLVAGRCASASFLGHYGGKSEGNMLAIGQAAGVAGALCAQLGIQPRHLDYKLVQQGLRKMDISL